MRSYEKVKRITERAILLNSIKRLLHWDERVMMPENIANIRAQENKIIQTTIHRHLISNTLYKHIKAAKKENLTQEEQINLFEIERTHLRLKNVKQSLITKRAITHTETLSAWNTAYQENNYKIFEPHFSKTIKLSKQYAKAINKKNPYEALLQEFDIDLTFEEINTLLEQAKNISDKIIEQLPKTKENNLQIQNIEINEEKRLKFNTFLAQKIGLDITKARIDWSKKSFSTYYGRIGIKKTNWLREIKTILHEAGHSLYEQNLPHTKLGTPIAEIRSFSIDESQAIIWEKIIGQTPQFWTYLTNKLKEFYEIPYDSTDILKEIKKIKDTDIRLESDELNYIRHIYLRFQLEQELINGKLTTKKLPTRWKTLTKKILPKANSSQKGPLQDIHWAKGNIGYFPHYIIGSIIAAQLYEAMLTENPNLLEQIEQGNFEFIKNWLKEKIHKHGKKYTTKELIKNATNKELSIEAYQKYLEQKYLINQ